MGLTSSVAGTALIFILTSCGSDAAPPAAQALSTANASTAHLVQILHMGQSLASGEDGFPIVTVADTGHGNFQFQRGVHTWREQQPAYCVAPQTRPDSDFNLVPIVAGETATSTGETIASGLVDSLTHSQPPGTDTSYLFSYAGVGNTRLRDLDKRHDDTTDPRSLDPTPGGFYKTSIDDVKRAKTQAETRGWTYEVDAITWMQGEKNNDLRLDDWDEPLDRTSFLTAYSQDLINLKNDWNSDILPLTQQSNRIPMFSYQTQYAISGQAQLQASDMDPEIYVVTPTYYMFSAINSRNARTGAWGAAVHLTGDSQRWLGEQFSKVIQRVMIGKQSWQPLRPVAAWASTDRQTVYVKYHVPVSPIVIENSFMPAAAGAGLFIPGGPDIASASVFTSDTIALSLASPLPVAGTSTLEYASEHGTTRALSLPAGALKNESATFDQRPAYEIVITGDVRSLLSTVLQHGAFYLEASPNIIGVIRDVHLDTDGNTILEGENEELSNGTSFPIGRPLTVAMIWPYGNIRDSDNEQSSYKFQSGPSAGKAYPLWNWSVSFEGLVIDPSPPAQGPS